MTDYKFPSPPDYIPILKETNYELETVLKISQIPKNIYTIKNDPDKLIKKYKLGEACKEVMSNLNLLDKSYIYNELILTYKAGNLGIGAKLYGYYIKNDYIFMILERLEGKELLYVEKSNIESIYNTLLKKVSVLINNGIKHNDLSVYNIIIQSNDNVKIIDYGNAYEICKPHHSKTIKLIKTLALVANPVIFDILPDNVQERKDFYKYCRNDISIKRNYRRFPPHQLIDVTLLDPDLIPPDPLYEGNNNNLLNTMHIQLNKRNNTYFFHD